MIVTYCTCFIQPVIYGAYYSGLQSGINNYGSGFASNPSNSVPQMSLHISHSYTPQQQLPSYSGYPSYPGVQPFQGLQPFQGPIAPRTSPTSSMVIKHDIQPSSTRSSATTIKYQHTSTGTTNIHYFINHPTQHPQTAY